MTMSPQARPDVVELSFEVPDRLLGRIYIAIGTVLRRAQQSTTAEEGPDLHDWGETEAFADEAELADMAWRKFSPRAQAVFALLMENPGVAMQADEIAAKIGLANGRHGLAGVVAWPSRQCAEIGRTPPFRYESPPAPGETGSYWMDPETAQLFIAARERSLARQADLHPQN
jgi:hypothetical protein